jgi:adenosylmethionine-8-amino-7-oxononanoate aminotransferase
MRQGSGFFQHGHTYLGHPVACAAALAVQRVIATACCPRCARDGERLQALLQQRLGDHPRVGDMRGRGLFRGVELVADRATQGPLPAADRTHARIKAEAMERGLLCYPMGGTVDGAQGDHVLLAPPFTCQRRPSRGTGRQAGRRCRRRAAALTACGLAESTGPGQSRPGPRHPSIPLEPCP